MQDILKIHHNARRLLTAYATVPEASMVMPMGALSATATPTPSEAPGVPDPAKVETKPEDTSIRRILWLVL